LLSMRMPLPNYCWLNVNFLAVRQQSFALLAHQSRFMFYKRKEKALYERGGIHDNL
jgi:hypothetical protein